MRIILVAGGSGGHIYPCLELAKYLVEKKEHVMVCGCNNSMEEAIYKENDLDFRGVDINKKKILNLLSTHKRVKQIYKEFNPDLIILFGNYISVGFGVTAILNNIPIYLHEQNVIYGDANILLGIKAKRIYLSLPINKDFYKNKSLLVGNPKSDVKTEKFILDKSKGNILIAMGSLGSSSINKVIKEFINISNKEFVYHIVVGKKYYNEFLNLINEKSNVKIYPYLENLSSYIKECDLFISRAGATTISEILTMGSASIIIPSPYVKHNHQYKNAKYLLDNDACVLINEQELSAIKLDEEINMLMNNYKRRLELKYNARKLAVFNSNKRIYEDLKKDYER